MQRSDLKQHIVETYGISENNFERLHEEFLAFYNQTIEEYVGQRHLELQKAGKKNDEIYRLIRAELDARRFAVKQMSERQIRRLVYG
ncbi:MAG: hypothetical protein ABSF77_12875 [Spirochaetia bacterium]|jgi:hypothetical protein